MTNEKNDSEEFLISSIINEFGLTLLWRMEMVEQNIRYMIFQSHFMLFLYRFVLLFFFRDKK